MLLKLLDNAKIFVNGALRTDQTEELAARRIVEFLEAIIHEYPRQTQYSRISFATSYFLSYFGKMFSKNLIIKHPNKSRKIHFCLACWNSTRILTGLSADLPKTFRHYPLHLQANAGLVP
jgi:hypothetical protein